MVLILFVTVASLVTSKFRYRDILKDVRFCIAFLLIIILSFLVWFSQREQQNPNAPSTNGIQSQAVEVLDKEEMN